MQKWLVSVILVLTAGCGAPDDSEAPVVSNAPPQIDAKHWPSQDVTGQNLCAHDREWDLRATGSGYSQYEGRTVWLSAVEPEMGNGTTTHPVSVFVAEPVTDGAFSIGCDNGLRTNMWYPSVAVVIDADGNGACGPGDLAFSNQYYGWMSDQIVDIPGATPGWWFPAADPSSTGFDGSPFCQYYFPG